MLSRDAASQSSRLCPRASDRLSIIVVNFRSLKNKSTEFTELLSMSQPDVVIGTESWLNSDITSSEVFPSGFKVYRRDRDARGGGVFILVDIIDSVRLHNFDSFCESVWCRLNVLHGNCLVVGSFYRSPILLVLNNFLVYGERYQFSHQKK